ncbi:hypothetical protein OSTOST_09298, partial [Ostertagia ostertagi]
MSFEQKVLELNRSSSLDLWGIRICTANDFRFSVLFAIITSYFSTLALRGHHHDVYWNSSNPIFEPFDNAIDSPGYYELVARPLDIVRFHCPRRKAKEYSLIYK